MILPRYARAAVMVAANEPLEIKEYPMPTASRGEALARVECCTVCRSDLHTLFGRRPGPVPAILGHEIVGTLVQLGEGLTHDCIDQQLSIGDRVTWTLHRSCGSCFYCLEKQLPMKCRELHKYGHDACDEPPHLRGGFAEYCLLERGTGLLRLPENLSSQVAAPANCATATIMAGWDAADLKPLENVLVQGTGALGCYAAAYAAFCGCSRVIAADIDPGRLEFSRRFGVTDGIDCSQCTPEEMIRRVKDLTGGFGVDCVLEAAGVPAAIETGLKTLRKGGRYIEIGCSFPEARASIDMAIVLWNLLSIHGVHNYDTCHLHRAVKFLSEAKQVFPFEEMIGETYCLEDINSAVQAAEAGKAMRIAVSPNRLS